MKVGDLVTHSDRYAGLMHKFDEFYSRKNLGVIVKTRPNMFNDCKMIYKVFWDDGTIYDHDGPELKLI